MLTRTLRHVGPTGSLCVLTVLYSGVVASGALVPDTQPTLRPMPATFLITGATGHLGRAVIRQLLTRTPADRIAALARDAGKADSLRAAGVDVRVGDYDDTASLDRAMEGIETVLLVSSGDQGDRLLQHRNVIEVAVRAGVGRIGYTGRSLADPDTLRNTLMTEHVETERMIEASGLAASLFRNALYMETVPQFIGGPRALDAGIFLPAGDGRVAFALRREQGEAIANALLEAGTESRVHTLTGSEAWSFGDVAEALSDLTGKTVSYTAVSEADFKAQMQARGLPDPVIGKITDFVVDVRNGQESPVTGELEALLGRPPASLADGLKEVFEL